jgi:hypothetical protein
LQLQLHKIPIQRHDYCRAGWSSSPENTSFTSVATVSARGVVGKG